LDATVEHLDQTNKWLSELDEFKDLVPDMPTTELRVGYAAAAPPPLRDRASPQLQPGRRVTTGQKRRPRRLPSPTPRQSRPQGTRRDFPCGAGRSNWRPGGP